MLTRRQREALDFIRTTLQANGTAPTFREIGDHLGMASKSGVARLVDALQERGLIRRLPGRQQSIELVAQHALEATPTADLRAELARRGVRYSEASA